MATLSSLNRNPISSASPEEGLQHILAIRAARLAPRPKSSKKATPGKGAKKKAPPKLSPQDAADLLKLIQGDS